MYFIMNDCEESIASIKAYVMIIGGIFLLIGLYLLLFKRNDTVLIYTNAIVLNLKEKKIVKKEDIESIMYEKMKVRKSPVENYYPVLVLKNGDKILINVAFNAALNKNFEAMIKSYL
jgi:hypothetical protein